MKQPGDKLASAMEYMPGKGVYEEKGELFAGVCGTVKEDNENERIIYAQSIISRSLLAWLSIIGFLVIGGVFM